MWPYHPDLLGQAVPRYTSYPTAAEFTDSVGAADQAEALAAVGNDTPVSLYLHIPYCRQICWYCGCNTGAAGRSHRLGQYLDALGAEIDLVAARLADRGRVARVAFGGGSPNAVPPAAFAGLVARLNAAFPGVRSEVSVELDPRDCGPDWADTLANAGVTRVSLGVQSFSPGIQAAIGRIQPRARVEACVAQLRAAGIESVNFDLMYGLPAQTLADLEDTLTASLAIAPSRIALFGYAHLPDLLPRQRRIDASVLPDGALRFQMAALGYGHLVANNYVPVGFDHFARPDDGLARAAREGRVRRNFQGFTDDDCAVTIGLGASAISRFPGLIVQNEKMAGPYRDRMAKGVLAGTRGIRLDADEQRRAQWIEGVLACGTSGPVPLGLWQEVKARLVPLAARGLITLNDQNVVLTDAGLPYARIAALAFDRHRAMASGTFSLAV